MTIIGGAILGFLITSTTIFGNVGEDAELQNEAQISFNQIGDLIIDSTNGLKLFYNDDKMYLDNSDIASTETVSSKTLAIYNLVPEKVVQEGKEKTVEKLYVYNVIWENSENKLFLRKDEVTDLIQGTVKKGEKNLMAEFVSDFSPSLAKVDKKNKMTISLSYKKGKSLYYGSKTYTLRNRTVVNKSLTDIYDNVVVDVSDVTGVEITQNGLKVSNVTLWKNEKRISFGKKIIGIGFPTNDVEWRLDGCEDDQTTVIPSETGCTVLIGDNETADSLSLVAVSKFSKEGKLPVSSDPVTIFIKEITGISFGVAEHEGKFYKGQDFIIKADISSIGVLTDEEKQLNWSITGATRDEHYNINGPEQKLTITAKGGEKVKISATSVKNNKIKKEYQITVSNPDYSITLKTDNDATALYRGSSLRITADISPDNGDYGEISWNVIPQGNDGIDISKYVSINSNNKECTISVSNDMPDEYSGYLDVEASLPQFMVKSSIRLSIPHNVTISISGPDSIDSKGANATYTAEISKTGAVAEWTITKYPNNAGDPVTHLVDGNKCTILNNYFYTSTQLKITATYNFEGRNIVAEKIITLEYNNE